MKLVTSTGDFSYYVDTVAEKVRCLKGTKFKYINLEQTGNIPELMSDYDSDYLRLADDFGNAAAYAGVKYVVSHAPCHHFIIPEAYGNKDDETYRRQIRAIRRSIEICHILGIPRIVVHACVDRNFPRSEFSQKDFYTYNEAFYREFYDLMEKYNITVMTENWDNSRTHFSTGRQIRAFLDYMNHPLLGACWDTAHGNIDLAAREIGQYRNIVDIGDKLFGLHISDNFGDTHHHTWPFAGIINFDSVMQGLIDVSYNGFFTFEASYTLLHEENLPYSRAPFEYNGDTITKLLRPSIELKRKAVDLLYETGKYILTQYDLFEE